MPESGLTWSIAAAGTASTPGRAIDARIAELLAQRSVPVPAQWRSLTVLGALLDHARTLVPRRSVILLLSDLLDPNPELRHQLEHLRYLGHEIMVLQILDPDEIDFPFTQGSVFEDPESGARRRIQPARVRERYLERFQQFQEETLAAFRAMEVLHELVRTDADPGSAIATFLSRRRLFA